MQSCFLRFLSLCLSTAMLFFALLKRDSLAFFLANAIRILGVIVMLLIISSEITAMINNIKGFTRASHAPSSQDNSNISSPVFTSSSSASLHSVSTRTTSIALSVSSTRSSILVHTSRSSSAASATSTKNTEKRSNNQRSVYAKRHFKPDTNISLPINQSNTVAAPIRLIKGNSTTPRDCGYFDSTNVPKQAGGILFACLQTILNIVLLVFLVLSEVPLPIIAQFYVNWFPPLGPDHGVGWLGALMVYVCTGILSKRCNTYSLVTSWMGFVLACLNIICGLFFGKRIRERRSLLSFLPKPLQRKVKTTKEPGFQCQTGASVHFEDSSQGSNLHPRKIIEIGKPTTISTDPVPPYPNTIKSRFGTR